jgi:hypothetical protein
MRTPKVFFETFRIYGKKERQNVVFVERHQPTGLRRVELI